MFTQVLDEVVPISDLRRMRQCSLHCIRVSIGAIPADHVNFLVLLQPGEDGFSGAIGQEIEWLAGLKIDQNGSIPVPTPEGSGKGSHVAMAPSPSSREALLPPSPLRTAQASFPACRSS